MQLTFWSLDTSCQTNPPNPADLEKLVKAQRSLRARLAHVAVLRAQADVSMQEENLKAKRALVDAKALNPDVLPELESELASVQSLLRSAQDIYKALSSPL